MQNKWIWVAVAAGVVLVVMMARRGSSPTVTTLGGEDAGAGDSELLQARAQGFSAIAGIFGSLMQGKAEGEQNLSLARIGAETQLGLAEIQSGIEDKRNVFALALANIQAAMVGQQTAASAAASREQAAAQAAAAGSMAKSQNTASWLDFFGDVASMVGNIVGKGKNGTPPGGTPGLTTGLPGGKGGIGSGLVYIGTDGHKPKGF